MQPLPPVVLGAHPPQPRTLDVPRQPMGLSGRPESPSFSLTPRWK